MLFVLLITGIQLSIAIIQTHNIITITDDLFLNFPSFIENEWQTAMYLSKLITYENNIKMKNQQNNNLIFVKIKLFSYVIQLIYSRYKIVFGFQF